MRESVRAYLRAGLSSVAVGAIVAAPMSPTSPQAASPLPQVRINDVQLAALSTPLTSRRPAERPEVVHLLAELSRGLTSMEVADAASIDRANPLLSSAASARADVKADVVTARNPATAAAPDSDNRQALEVPNSAAADAIDAPAIGGVLATVTQLALDTAIAFPATFVQGTVANLNQVIIAAGTLDPNAVSWALQAFVTGERITLGVLANGLIADINSISDALGKLDTSDGGGGVAAALKVGKTTELATATGVGESGAVDEATSKEQRGHVIDAGSRRDVVAGKGSQDGSSGSTQSQNTAGGNDGDVTMANPSDIKVSESSHPKSTDDDTSDDNSGAASGSRQNTATATAGSKTNTSDTKSGDVSGSRHNSATATATSKSNASDNKPGGTSQSNHTFKKAHNSGGQSAGKHRKSGGKHRKNG